MKQTAIRSLITAGVVLCALWFSTASVHSQEAAKSDAHNTPKPAIVKVETGKIVIETSLKGIVEAEKTTEVFLDAKIWMGPFVIKSAARHGSSVKKGDLILNWRRKNLIKL